MSDKTTLTLDNAPKATAKLVDTVDVTPIDKLAELVEAETSAETATTKLSDFRLTHVAKALLDRAVVNVSENTGKGLEDPLARDSAETLAGIFEASGHDLSKVIDFTLEAMGDDPKAALNMIYKECYAVQKALNFIGNMTYRRALDLKGDFDLEAFVDYREENRSAPYGLEPLGDYDVNDQAYSGQEDHEIVLAALEEVHIFLQLITEAYGWEPEQMMPYAVVQEKDESFSQIHDLVECLDLMELRFKESRRKRQEKQLMGLRAIQEMARAKLKKAVSK